MSESSLTTPRSEILAAVGAFFDYGRNQYQWEREQREQVYRCVRSGERKFYASYGWSFLRLLLALDITDGTANYDLPDGFGGFFDPELSFSAADNQFWPVKNTSVPMILQSRQYANLTAAIQPTLFAVNAKTPTGSTGQRFEILLFPTPIADGTLNGSYYANPDATTDALPYAQGGAIHSETLLTSCLAAAELERDKKSGPLKVEYNEALAKSLAHEKSTGPKHFGYNADRSVPGYASIYDLRTPTITRNGIAISGW